MDDPRRFRIGVLARPAGLGLARLGPRAGASTEFRDHRDYMPGDDIRHIDWRAYARTDRLMIKRFFEETSPELLLVVDASASMKTDPKKQDLADQLATFITAVAQQEGLRVRIQRLEHDFFAEIQRVIVRPGMGCLLLSDLLFAAEPQQWLRPLMGAAGLAVLQVLSTEDLEPELGALRLSDAETGEARDLMVDPQIVSRYKERLTRLCEGIAEACRGQGANYLQLQAALPAPQVVDALLRAGVITAR